MTQVFSNLPEKRKSIGKYNHLQIYKNLNIYKNNLHKLNSFLGNVFPSNIEQYKIKIYFEVKLGHRIPDCIIILISHNASLCYFLEFKTTYVESNTKTLCENKIHQAQYLQGLKQLNESISFLSQFQNFQGTKFLVYPAIYFFKQNSLNLNFFKCFKNKIMFFDTSFILQFLRNHQDAEVQTILSISNFSDFRRTCAKYSHLHKRRCSKITGSGHNKFKTKKKPNRTRKTNVHPIAK